MTIGSLERQFNARPFDWRPAVASLRAASRSKLARHPSAGATLISGAQSDRAECARLVSVAARTSQMRSLRRE